MIHALVLLTCGPLGLDALREYEAQVLPILAEHGGKLLSAFRPFKESGTEPDEIHLIEFPTQGAFTSYRADPRIVALSRIRARAIKETQLYISAEFAPYSLLASPSAVQGE